jgi:ParB family chromosome partitioning protein
VIVQDLPMASVYRRIEGARPLVSERVEAIKSSIARVGQLNPIHVRRCTRTDGPKKIDAYEIIAGGHRFEAMWQLNRETISAVVLDEDSVQQRLVEIAENLHRAELTALERSEQIAEWCELTGDSFLQSAKNSTREGRPGVISAASRELGIERTEAHRAVKVASLHPEAKSAAIAVGLDDNRAALLEAAREKTPQAQVAVLHERAERRQRPVSPARDALNDIEVLERQVEALMSAWNKASKEAREEFLLRVDTPVFDNSRVA